MTLRLDVTDREFDRIFPKSAQKVARALFTPVAVARRAAELLVPRPGARVLDVGSGAGKFCFVGALATRGVFTGVELDDELVTVAKTLAREHAVPRVSFKTGDALAVDWSGYDGVYLYNPFSAATEARFVEQVAATVAKLQTLKPGARVAVLNGFGGELPDWDPVAEEKVGALTLDVRARR